MCCGFRESDHPKGRNMLRTWRRCGESESDIHHVSTYHTLPNGSISTSPFADLLYTFTRPFVVKYMYFCGIQMVNNPLLMRPTPNWTSARP